MSGTSDDDRKNQWPPPALAPGKDQESGDEPVPAVDDVEVDELAAARRRRGMNRRRVRPGPDGRLIFRL